MLLRRFSVGGASWTLDHNMEVGKRIPKSKKKFSFRSIIHCPYIQDFKKTRTTTLLDWDWLYDILDLDLKNTQTTLQGSVWFFDILDLKSVWTTFTGARLILWYIGFGLKKHLDCLTGLGLIFFRYIGLGL